MPTSRSERRMAAGLGPAAGSAAGEEHAERALAKKSAPTWAPPRPCRSRFFRQRALRALLAACLQESPGLRPAAADFAESLERFVKQAASVPATRPRAPPADLLPVERIALSADQPGLLELTA